MPYDNTIGAANGGHTSGVNGNGNTSIIRKSALQLATASYKQASKLLRIGRRYSVYLMKDKSANGNYESIRSAGTFTPNNIVQGTANLSTHDLEFVRDELTRRVTSAPTGKHVKAEDVILDLSSINKSIEDALESTITGIFTFDSYISGVRGESFNVTLSKFFPPNDPTRMKPTERETALSELFIDEDDVVLLSLSSEDSIDLSFSLYEIIAQDCKLMTEDAFTPRELKILRALDQKLRFSLVECS